MNYYERHLGDYARDTGHLSLVEHGIYTLLLDRYYASESPIPDADKYRVARARTRDEKAALDAVLAEFFVLDDGRWHNKRADAEIEIYRGKEPVREKKKADAAERQRRARERRVELFELARSRGIVMPITAKNADIERAIKQLDDAQRYAHVTRDDTLTQSPDTSPQTPDKPLESDPTYPPERATVGAGAPRSAGQTLVDPDFEPDADGLRLALSHQLDANAERERFVAHYAATGEYRTNWQAQYRKWLLHAMQHRADAEKRNARSPPKRSLHEERAATLAALTGRNRNRDHDDEHRTIDITPHAPA